MLCFIVVEGGRKGAITHFPIFLPKPLIVLAVKKQKERRMVIKKWPLRANASRAGGGNRVSGHLRLSFLFVYFRRAPLLILGLGSVKVEIFCLLIFGL